MTQPHFKKPMVPFLPPEIVENVLIHLPVNGNLASVAFASKRLFAQTLFSLRFAYGHILHQSHATRDYRHMLISVYLTWNALPTCYRALFYCCVVGSIDSLLNRYQFKLVPSLKAKQYVESVLELRQRWTVEAKQATLLHASTNNQFDVVLVLLQDPLVNPACHNDIIIRKACEFGNVGVVRLLLAHDLTTNHENRFRGKVDPAANCNQAIQRACGNGHEEIVQLLLESGRVDPTAHFSYSIRAASRDGREDIVRLLLESGCVNAAAEDNEAIRIASRNGHMSVVKLLLQSGLVDPSDQENEAIRMASQRGHLGVVKLLLDNENVNPAMHGRNVACSRLMR